MFPIHGSQPVEKKIAKTYPQLGNDRANILLFVIMFTNTVGVSAPLVVLVLCCHCDSLLSTKLLKIPNHPYYHHHRTLDETSFVYARVKYGFGWIWSLPICSLPFFGTNGLCMEPALGLGWSRRGVGTRRSCCRQLLLLLLPKGHRCHLLLLLLLCLLLLLLRINLQLVSSHNWSGRSANNGLQ